MFKKLDVRLITIEYKKSFQTNGKILNVDKFQYFFLPYLLAFILCWIKLPDNELRNLLGTSLSIFIGLFLNIIAILVSQINAKKADINFTEQQIRIDILHETIYNILYALLQSIKALIALYLMGIIVLDNSDLGKVFYLVFEQNLDYYIQFILGFFLFKFNISLLFSFYVIIKNIVALFQKDIDMEKYNVRKEQNQNEV